MNTTPSSASTPDGARALVLGGGGASGNAWLIGVIAGLVDAGVDVRAADRIIGTSAGSTAAAQILGGDIAELRAAAIAPPGPMRASPGRGAPGAGPRVRPTSDHLARTNAIIAGSRGAADMRRAMGKAAIQLAQAADDDAAARWRDTVAARLPSQQWPESTLLITAVNATSGEPVVFDATSGVELADAIAASCSSGPAYRIGTSWFIDGGYRRNENADLAGGCARVLVLSPFGGRSRMPLAWGMQLAAQVDELREAGSRVETMCPEPSDAHLFGANAMNLSLRPAAAEAGLRQGRELAANVREFWET